MTSIINENESLSMMSNQSSYINTPNTPITPTTSHGQRLVVMVGRARSGKDTCANYLRDVWGYKVAHFAGPLKKGSKEFFGFNDDQLNGESKMSEDPYWGITPRMAFQLIGTELMRNQFPKLVMNELQKLNPGKEISNHIGENFWIKSINMDYQRLLPNEKMCIADGRFPNETAFSKERNGVSIRINRAGTVKMDHDSERFIDELDVDHDIDNNETIEKMLEKVRDILHLYDNGESAGIYTHDEYIETVIKSNNSQSANNEINNQEPDMQVIVLLGNQKHANTTIAWSLHDKLKYTIIDGKNVSENLHKAYSANPNGRYVAILGDMPYIESQTTPTTLIEVRSPMARARYLAHHYVDNESPSSSAEWILDMITDCIDLDDD
jgi:hypothetical protein